MPDRPPDVTPEVAAVIARLHRSASAITRTWLSTVAVQIALLVLWSSLALAMLYFRNWVGLAAVACFGLTCDTLLHLVPPRHRERQHTTSLTTADRERVAGRVGEGENTWIPADVAVCLDPVLHDDTTFVLGLPFLACLHPKDLRILIRWAELEVSILDSVRIRRARRVVAVGEKAQRIHMTWSAQRLDRVISERSSDVAMAVVELRALFRMDLEVNHPEVLASADAVDEAWSFLQENWIVPALELGVRPSSSVAGLHHLMQSLHRDHPTHFAELPEMPAGISRYEDQLTIGSALRPIAWEEYPEAVTTPRWRRALTSGLEAATRATGAPLPATLESLMNALDDGWGLAIASQIMVADVGVDAGITDEPWAALGAVLNAAVALTAVEGQSHRLDWRWPTGTVVVDSSGNVLPVGDIVGDALEVLADGGTTAGLRDALGCVGISARLPLWLDGGEDRARVERILVDLPAGYATPGFSRTRGRHLLVSDRAIRVQPAQGGRLPSSQEILLEIRHDDVVSVEFARVSGGLMWRACVLTADASHLFSGEGRYSPHAVLRHVFGDRLHTVGIDLPQPVKLARTGLAWSSMAVGAVLIVVVLPYYGANEHGGPALASLLAGLVFFVLPFVPYWIQLAWNQLCHPDRRGRLRAPDDLRGVGSDVR